MSLPIASDSRSTIATSMHDTTIRLENVSVRYRLPQERIGTFKEYAIRALRRRVGNHDFWALRNLNLEVGRGEVLGIIGRNGAGKSTLLKVVARVLRPTEGCVWIKGHVAPLLEYGAGFHPELTGRENVFVNGTLLGFTRRQMLAKFDRIVAFSELREFIDAPLRTYSSGMVARLGFAIATDERPDVLIVDEILSVGDEAFQRKSAARLQEYRDQGATILFVTHNMTVARSMCRRAMWLDHGVVRALGDVDDVAARYQREAS